MIKKLVVFTMILLIASCSAKEEEWIIEAKSRLEQGKLEEAKTAIEQAIKLNNKNAEAHNLYGVIAYQLKDFELSLIEYKKAVELDPANLNAQLNLSNAYLEKQQWAEAKQVLDFLIFNKKETAEVYLKRGISLAGLLKVPEAIQDFGKAISLDSTNFDSYYNRGNIYFQQGKFSLAIQDFEQCVNLKNESGKAFYALGLAYYRNNELEKACISLKQAKQVGYVDANEAIEKICI